MSQPAYTEPGDIDTTFDVGIGADGPVYAIKADENGNLVVGGYFTSFNGNSSAGIVRLDSSGGIDPTFNAGTGIDNSETSYVLDIAIQDDGKILVVGDFEGFNGTPAGNIVRLNTDGSIDNTFGIGSGANTFIRKVVIQPDGKILLGGAFTTFNQSNASYIVRLNQDGTIDDTFNTDYVTNSTVMTAAIQPDGRIIIGGEFSMVDGMSRRGIARLNSDGSLDTTFAVGTGFDGYIEALLLQPDGKILCGGTFFRYNGFSRSGLVRLSSNGELDTGFFVNFRSSDKRVYGLAFDGDRILVSGEFSQIDYFIDSPFLARIRSDGSLDESFSHMISGIWISPLLVVDGQKVIAGGNDLINYDTDTHLGNLIRLETGRIPIPEAPVITSVSSNYYESINLSFQSSIYAFTYSIEESLDGSTAWTEVESLTDSTPTIPKQIYENLYDKTGGTEYFYRIIAANPEGFSPPSAVLSVVTPDAPDPLTPSNISLRASQQNTMIIEWNGSVHARGYEIQRSYDGEHFWESVGITDDFPSTFEDEDLIEEALYHYRIRSFNESGYSEFSSPASHYTLGYRGAGYVDLDCGPLAERIYRIWSAAREGLSGLFLGTDNSITKIDLNSFSIDSSFPTVALNERVYSLTPIENGKVYAGGEFTRTKLSNTDTWIDVPRILRFNSNGTIDPDFDVGTGPDNDVFVTTPLSDGSLLVGGSFSSFNGKPYSALVRLDQNGNVDESFLPHTFIPHNGYPTATIHSITNLANGQLLIAGQFSMVDDMPAGNLLRLNQNGSIDNSFTASTNGAVLEVIEQVDGKLLLAGQFTSINGVSATQLARLQSDGSIDPTFMLSQVELTPRSLMLDAQGRILVGAYPNQAISKPGLVRFHSNGTIDTDLKSIVDDDIIFLSEWKENRILAVGNFSNINDQPHFNLAVLYSETEGYAPDSVADFTNGLVSGNTAQATWKTQEGVVYYEIEQSSDGNTGWAPLDHLCNSQSSFFLESLIPQDEYFYRIRAYNAYGESTYSEMSFIAFSDFEAWKTYYSIEPSALASNDSDGNGLPLLLEFGLGVEPGSQIRKPFMDFKLNGNNSGEISFVQKRADLEYGVEESSNLSLWNVLPQDPIMETDARKTFVVPITDKNSKYFRIFIEIP